jgi:hypothetical protein
MAASQKDIERLKKLRRMGEDKSIPESARERFMDEAADMEYKGYEKSQGKKCGGSVKKYAAGGSVRGAGAATKGIRKCKIV